MDTGIPLDAHWRSVLEYLAVPNEEGLYIVGSFAKSVTVYSQQVRALNLIDAMCGMGKLRRSSRVAIIGGGIAGLTAAAALVQMGVSVDVFEKEADVIPLQRNSSKRYLHPRVYDWPLTAIDDQDAQLPVLSWQAGAASAVAANMQAAWATVVASASGHAKVHTGAPVTSLARMNAQWRIAAREGSGDFDVVLVCVGFGVEEDSDHSLKYWSELRVDDPETHRQRWLVSGAGDGALTDVIRLCIRNFDHGQVLHEVEKTQAASGRKNVDIIRENLAKGAVGEALFAGVDADAIAEKLALRGDLDGKAIEAGVDAVAFNASREEVFGAPGRPARSSVLNRTLVWVLVQRGKVELVPGRIRPRDIAGHRGELQVPFSSPDSTRTYYDVLLRHGPAGPFGRPGEFQLPQWMEPGLEWPVERLSETWIHLYDVGGVDPTVSRSLWEGDDLFTHDRLAPDFHSSAGLLIYSRGVVESQEDDFQLMIAGALCSNAVLQARAQLDGVSLVPSSATISAIAVEDAFRSPRWIGRAIQALCDAPIVVVDTTIELPSTMLLLGIRAVVRRGVTVTVRVRAPGPDARRDESFSLRETRVVEIFDRTSEEQRIQRAVLAGLKRYADRPFHYSDLPAFDDVRSMGGNEDDYRPVPAETEVIVLCPFDGAYTSSCWPQLRRQIKAAVVPDGDYQPARRVIDLESPELVGRRLYASLRRDVVCVADVSLTRPNVYFELGVRLAVNKNGARVIWCDGRRAASGEMQPELFDADRQRVDRALGARKYSLKPNESTRSIAAALELATVSGKTTLAFATGTGGTLTPGYVFTMVSDNINPLQETGGRSVGALLWQVIEEVGGRDLMRVQTTPVLFAERNAIVKAQSRRFTFDVLLAYVAYASALPTAQRDRRNLDIAMTNLEEIVKEFDDAERARLDGIIAGYREHLRDHEL